MDFAEKAESTLIVLSCIMRRWACQGNSPAVVYRPSSVRPMIPSWQLLQNFRC